MLADAAIILKIAGQVKRKNRRPVMGEKACPCFLFFANENELVKSRQ